jgi:MoaA/NifB/PqqE/SkfB family radical SAM enzyme
MSQIMTYHEIIKFLTDNLHAHDTILITGGEPTMHPEFLNIIRYIKESYTDVKIDILTNAISFANASFTDSVASYIDAAHCSFYSFSERITSYLTGNPKAYAGTCAGIRNIIDVGINHDIRTLINIRTTYRTLDRTTKTIYDLFEPPMLIYSGVDPCGGVEQHPGIMVTLSEAAPHLTNALDAALQSGMEPHLMYYPICMVPARLRGRVRSDVCNRAIDAFFSECDIDTNPERYDNAYVGRCDHCAMKKNCTGAWRRYLSEQGHNELRPIEA